MSLKTVEDIIDLKIKCGNIQEDATLKNLFEFYYWGLQSGNVLTLYKGSNLIGFLSWCRYDEVPITREEAHAYLNWNKQEGKILYIINACCKGKGFWKLVHMVKEINKDCHTYCWHEGNNGTLKLWKNNHYMKEEAHVTKENVYASQE